MPWHYLKSPLSSFPPSPWLLFQTHGLSPRTNKSSIALDANWRRIVVHTYYDRIHIYICIYTCIRGAYNIVLNIVRTADKIFDSVRRELRDNGTSAWLRGWSTRDVEREREREFCLFRGNVSKVLAVNVRGQFVSSGCMYVRVYEDRRNDCFHRGCYYYYVSLSKAYNRLVTNWNCVNARFRHRLCGV